MAPKPQKWPADQVERWPLDRLIPYARNARTHSDEQVWQIAASMQEWGLTNPVLADEEGSIIAGHGRVLAARKLGFAEAPVMVARGWTEAQKRAYVLADNKLALNVGWDDALLKVELADLAEMGFDLPLIGFGEDELARITGSTGGHTDPDETPEAPADPVSELGDLWILGNHRIICGDSTDADCVGKVLAGAKPLLMVTDPPYGVKYDPDWRNHAKIKGRPVGGTSIGTVLNDDKADWREAWALFPGDVAYVWHGGLHAHTVAGSLDAAGFALRAQVIWRKQIMIIGRGDYHWQHEACWYAVRKGKTGHWQGDRKQKTVWDIENKTGVAKGGKGDEMQTGHGTQKPVECMRRSIDNNSAPGQAVYEPFSGSGSTIIAAEMTGRHAHAIELNPAYVDVAVARWQAFTKETAVLESDGRSFDEVAGERKAA
jgi:DNA modification methylase